MSVRFTQGVTLWEPDGQQKGVCYESGWILSDQEHAEYQYFREREPLVRRVADAYAEGLEALYVAVMELAKASVRLWLGHADVQTTQRYAHLAPGALAATVREMEAGELEKDRGSR